uniref:Acetylserotonin O-methyltransferase-like n=1 Tax=Astatotilapia calliptera TaxID=8154 RepID=A0AAX7UC54_ASTCA
MRRDAAGGSCCQFPRVVQFDLKATMVLNPVISKLAGKLVVLASASPRRLEILRSAGLRFEVVPSWFKETLDKGLFKAPHEYAVETAKQKALEVARRMPFKHLKTPDIVIGADTIVVRQKKAQNLSGKEHSVFTGVAIVLCHEKENEEVDYQLVDFYEETKVKFADLSEDMLWEYINSGEPMDKAGGYGIQALGGMLVEYVHGDFLNVVGFPLNHFCKQLDLIYNFCTSSLKKDSESESSQTLVNSTSKHTDNRKVKLHDNATLPSITRRGQVTEPTRGDLERICELMDGFKASKALFTASKLCLFDLLHSRPGLDAAQVAQEIKASAKGTECLLEACVSLGLLKSIEKVYENADLATDFLRSDAPCSLHGYLQHCNETMWPLFSHLESAVQEGTSQREKAFSKQMLQETSSSSREGKLRFMKAMHNIAKITGKTIATAFDLSTYKSACDLGGCTGALAYEFAEAHPGLSVTVFDLPAVVELNEFFHPQHPDNRVSFVAGDFLKDELPKADLYILARILHDLPDEKVHILLSKIADACTAGCGLLLSEIFLDEDRRGPSRGLLQALSMSEGKQRSATEYSLLLKSHGFITAHIRHTDNLLDAMLCIKA